MAKDVMRLYYLSPSEIPSRTANSVHVMKMCRAFAGNGNDVTLYAKEGDFKVADDYSHYSVKRSFDIVKCKRPRARKLKGDLLYAAEVARRIRMGPLPDLFYARHIYSLAAVARFGVPMIHEAHNPPVNHLQRVVERWVYARRNFLRLVVISDALRREYQRIFPWLPTEKLMVAHDCADDAGLSSESALHDRWPGREGSLQVGYVGHLYRGKGVELINVLASRMDEVDFHLVGGMESDIKLWRRCCIHRNVHFHGYVAQNLLPQYYRMFDVVLAPYQKKILSVGGKKDIARWMSPLKIFEYMAHGKAIVCSNSKVLKEILEHGVDAILVPPEDVGAWVDALELLKDDIGLRGLLGDAARRKLIARYTWENRARAVLGDLPIPGVSAGDDPACSSRVW